MVSGMALSWLIDALVMGAHMRVQQSVVMVCLLACLLACLLGMTMVVSALLVTSFSLACPCYYLLLALVWPTHAVA